MTAPKLPAYLTARPDGVSLAIKVQPRASANEIVPPDAASPELRVKVTAPPVDAAANEALLRLLADALGCARNRMQLIRGGTSRHKIVKICGLSAEAALERLSG
jgi:uncharacterized protein (TIGR00251 family)